MLSEHQIKYTIAKDRNARNMSVTRKGTQAQRAPKRIKFSDDGDELPQPEIATRESLSEDEAEDETNEQEAEDFESGSDSDDAPEEESTLQLKFALMNKLKEREQAEQEAKRKEKEKRKQRDLQFKQQQEEKRERIKELVKAEKLPDLLPDEVFEEDQWESKETVPEGTHLKSEHFEKELAAAKRKAKLEKLKQIKEMRKLSLKQGLVYVQVQKPTDLGNRAPRAEQSVLDSKSSWLQRDSLKRK